MPTNFEILMQKILNGEKISPEDWTPRSRFEECLIACINKTGTAGLKPPRTRMEQLLHLLAAQMADDIDAGDAVITVVSTDGVLSFDYSDAVAEEGVFAVSDDILAINSNGASVEANTLIL